jgi:hypothetical protein
MVDVYCKVVPVIKDVKENNDVFVFSSLPKRLPLDKKVKPSNNSFYAHLH